MRSLEQIRQEIDEIDSTLLELLLRRADISRQVADSKAVTGGSVYVPEREAQIIAKRAEGLPPRLALAAASFFKSLMRVSRELQYQRLLETHSPRCIQSFERGEQPSPRRVAFFGAPGSWSEQAAEALYPGVPRDGAPMFSQVFDALARQTADAAVLPIENSTAGTVADVYDLLFKHGFYISRAVTLDIRHCLCAPPGVELSHIKTVYSHPQALSQCAGRLSALGLTGIEAPSTSEAARRVSDNGDGQSGVLCSPAAAKLYGLTVLDEQMADNSENGTRFVAVTRDGYIPENPDTVSLAFNLPHESGTLSSVLSLLSDYGLNLTKIQSRPIPDRRWQYVFYLDFTGSVDDPRVLAALEQLECELPNLTLFGNYREH